MDAEFQNGNESNENEYFLFALSGIVQLLQVSQADKWSFMLIFTLITHYKTKTYNTI